MFYGVENYLIFIGTPETILDTVSETEEDIYIDRVVTSTPNPYESVENMQASLGKTIKEKLKNVNHINLKLLLLFF